MKLPPKNNQFMHKRHKSTIFNRTNPNLTGDSSRIANVTEKVAQGSFITSGAKLIKEARKNNNRENSMPPIKPESVKMINKQNLHENKFALPESTH